MRARTTTPEMFAFLTARATGQHPDGIAFLSEECQQARDSLRQFLANVQNADRPSDEEIEVIVARSLGGATQFPRISREQFELLVLLSEREISAEDLRKKMVAKNKRFKKITIFYGIMQFLENSGLVYGWTIDVVISSTVFRQQWYRITYPGRKIVNETSTIISNLSNQNIAWTW